MWIRFIAPFLFAAVVLPVHPVSAAPEPVELGDPGRYELGPHLELLEDRDGAMAAENALSSSFPADAFRPSGSAIPNFGYTSSAYLFRFRLKNMLPPGGNDVWFLEVAYPALDSITLAYDDGKGTLVRKQAGDFLPFGAREIESRNFVFRLLLRPGEERTFVLRIASTSSVQAPLTLWRPDDFRLHLQKSQFIFGIFYGFTLLLVLYNAVAYFFIRDENHLYYIFQTFVFALMQFSMNGFAYQFLWPGQPELANRSIPFCISLVGISSTLFTFNFLNIRRYLPRFHRRQWLVLAPAVLLLVYTVVGPYRPVMIASACLILPYICLIVALGIIALGKGYRPARYFLFAWSGMLVGAVSLAMSRLGVAPRTFWTEFGSQATFAAEAFILSIAITDRITTLKREKETAERRLHEDRQRIARDLHDVAGSALTDMLLRLRHPGDERGINRYFESRIETVMRHMRDTIFLLNQRDDFSLLIESELEQQASLMRSIGSFAVRLTIEPAGHRLSAAASHHAYRIFLEWTANIMKHARPRELVIRWRRKGEEVHLFIAHDGGAFSWDGSAPNGPGNGLRNIAARSAAIKARMRVIGLAGRCTLFLLKIPCPAYPSQEPGFAPERPMP